MEPTLAPARANVGLVGVGDRSPDAASRALRLSLPAVAFGFAWLRLSFGEQYRHAKWAALVDGTAPRPFGHRVLMPQIAGWVQRTTDLPLSRVWLGLETLSALALLVALVAIFGRQDSPGRAYGKAVAGLALLGVVLVAPRVWPIFYPWDTPAVAVCVGAAALAERGRYGWCVLLAGVGAFNRESAGLVPLIMLALRVDDEPDRRGLLAWASGAMAAVIAARVLIALWWPDNPGPALHLTLREEYRVFVNARWLTEPVHVAKWLAWGGWLALVWPWAARRAGWPWRRLGAVAWTWFSAAFVVANVYEPRAVAEALALAWLVVARAPTTSADNRGQLSRRLDAVYGWLVLAGVVALALSLAWSPWLPVAQWPMPK